MEKSHSNADVANLLNLGSVLGQGLAFGIVAGRCSAAQAACLHRLRRTNQFQLVTSRWREFLSAFRPSMPRWREQNSRQREVTS